VTTNPQPMLCAWCQRVRTAAGRWEVRDLGDRERAEATHGICPDCLARETRALCAAPSAP
jgi:hypothetical protein